jgi:O-antigen/teichoic acid export membrane protein
VLNVLGPSDYGLYNIVTGITAMFTFLNASMSDISRRYFSLELGRNDLERLRNIFNLNFILYIFIALVFLFLAETIGLWFLNNKITIPDVRQEAIQWVFQFSVISFIFTILTVPFMAIIIAHEEMAIYAYVSMAEVALKLVLVISLKTVSLDKLQLYGILMCINVIILSGTYGTICKVRYPECKFVFFWDKKTAKEIILFSWWSMFESFGSLVKIQMTNVLLNQFFGPILSAARSISSQITHVIGTVTSNFSTSVYPPIVKNYVAGEKIKILTFIFSYSKFIYILAYAMILPFSIELPTVLLLWLKNVPDNVVPFTRLMMIEILIDSLGLTSDIAIYATGKIKSYKLIRGTILLLNIPFSFLALQLHYPANSVFIISVCSIFLLFLLRLFILKHLINYSIIQFIKDVMFPVFIISLLSPCLPLFLYFFLKATLFRLFLILFASTFSVCIYSYIFALNNSAREMIKAKLFRRLSYLMVGRK